jgi:asparagine synthase (glutamine-hydrolysing)
VCGICGYLGDPRGIDGSAMIEALGHRGPDGRGAWRRATADGEVFLGHTRLAIIDLSPAGAQPMATPDGVHTISYNGEIYNYRALRAELEGRGYAFRGTSDTEVLLYLLREEGAPGLDRVRGMFALAFWDAEKQELLLARDPFGIKPLYYTDSAARLAFASELRALLRGGAAAPELDPAGVESYLAFGCVMRPQTMVRGVQTLEPGRFLRRRAGATAARLGRHSTLRAPATLPRTYAEAIETTAATLRRVVAEHMVADVPVGVLLSGGIDSSGLVATLSGQDLTVDTFTVIFAGEDESLSERPFAAAVAQRYGTRHHEVRIEGTTVDAVGEAVSRLDQPSIDGANTYVVCKAVRGAGITVVLSGLGADEVFLGYGNHETFARLRLLHHLTAIPGAREALRLAAHLPWPAPSFRQQKAIAYLATKGRPADAYAAMRGLFSTPRITALLGRPATEPGAFVSDLPLAAPPADTPSLTSALDLMNYMGNMLLRDSDVMSMAHSLELRVPYLDRDLVETVLSLPAALKLRRGRPKPLLVDAIQPPLPRAIVERRKRGFVLPFARWLRRDLYNDVADTFVDTSMLLGAGLDPPAAREVWRGYLTRHDESAWTRPWGLHVLARWVRENLATPTSRTEPATELRRAEGAAD